MKYILNRLALEVTRRCNIHCEHCMRGPSQNIDLTPWIVDYVLDSNKISRIEHLLFSGGEPTLNEDIIIYTINKIINEKLDVRELAMVTNGQIFSKRLVEAFNSFIEYRKNYHKDSFFEDNVRITFSVDRFHENLQQDVEKEYLKHAKGINFTKFCVNDKYIYKTGFATFGKEFDYKLKPVKFSNEGKDCYIASFLYVTSMGYLTSEGNGKYSDMDNINMGHISEITYEEILEKYGIPLFASKTLSLK